MIKYIFEDGKLAIGGKTLEPTQLRTLAELKPVLRNPDSSGPDPVYQVYRDIADPDKPAGMRADITILFPGNIGQELTKTHGHYHIGDGTEPYQLLGGSGVLIMQKPDFNYQGLEGVRLVKLVPGQPVEVPSGWGHTLINTGPDPLVTLNYQDPTIDQLYSAYEKNQGAAYYMLSDDTGTRMEANPHYANVPKLQTF